ncbi:MAG: hypothetical protein LBC69_02635 [Eubacteriaceae bacterium]|jgi:hypothetical protein|nr:hypothetical protein [Eubacteriaceae bacterium]
METEKGLKVEWEASFRKGAFAVIAQASESPLSLEAAWEGRSYLLEEAPQLPIPYASSAFLSFEDAGEARLYGDCIPVLCTQAPEGRLSDAFLKRQNVAPVLAQALCALFSLALHGYCHRSVSLDCCYFSGSALSIGHPASIAPICDGEAEARQALGRFVVDVWEQAEMEPPAAFTKAALSLNAGGEGFLESLARANRLARDFLGEEAFASHLAASPGKLPLADVRAYFVEGKKSRFYKASGPNGEKYFLKEAQRSGTSPSDGFIGAYSPYLAEILERRRLVSIFGEEGAEAYVSRYYSQTLSQAVRSGSLADEDRASLFLSLLLAIRDLAAMGKVHRDIKPSNILVRRDEFGRLLSVLGDFDTVVGCGDYVSSQGYTPNFSHPAIQEGSAQVSVLFDIYSAGVILYYLYKGTPLFGGSGPLHHSCCLFPDEKPQLDDSALQEMVEKSIQSINSQKRMGWGFDFLETRESPMKAIDAFLSAYLGYLSSPNGPKCAPCSLVANELAFYASQNGEETEVEYEIRQERGGVQTALRRTAYLRDGDAHAVEYAYLSKEGRLKRLRSADIYPPRSGVKYRERVYLFYFVRIGESVRYLIVDENYVDGAKNPEGELGEGICFRIEDEGSGALTTYTVLRVYKHGR